ncbi:MAG: cytochrome C [Bacteroidetes bacterium]|nr:cytochrome C [Bacteroidota bacterium]
MAQFSPGKLSEAHAEFEGLDNCTLCHKIGAQVSEQKCLECHKELQSLLDANRGYHSSKEVQAKTCVNCHSEHHGRKFDALHFDEDQFDHELAGYPLEGAHDRIDCRDCHKPDYIADPELAKRTKTFLGLEAACLSCHVDYHQEDLGADCLSCHNYESFKETPGFDHDETDFPLVGAHQEVQCLDCHPKVMKAGRDFQQFSNLSFQKCTDCHEDSHNGKFGENCTDCHREESWSILKNKHRFNHNLTDYPLEGQHKLVACNDCHRSGNFQASMPFARCTDCHEDYHQGEISAISSGVKDCDACHALTSPFTSSSYDWQDHQESDFALEGAHLATPCFACHKETENSRWDFQFESQSCVSCHDDVHQDFLSEKYYPNQDCEACHTAEAWSDIKFDHKETGWNLDGAHAKENCRACHYNSNLQRFKVLSGDCVECHDNVHGSQFEAKGTNNCLLCHRSALTWNADNFDHQQSQFPLEGKHAIVDCKACHKPELQSDGAEMIIYKIEKFECIDCHGS